MERAKFLVSNVSKEVVFAMGGDYIHSSAPLGTGKFFVRYVQLEAAKVSIPMLVVTDSSESSSSSEANVGSKAATDKEPDEPLVAEESEKEEDGDVDVPAEVGSADEDDEGDEGEDIDGAGDTEMPVLKFFFHPYDREFWSADYVKLFTPPKSSRWLERLDKKSVR